MVDVSNDNLVPHFIYCGLHYSRKKSSNQLRNIFLAKMESYEIQYAVVTMLEMLRRRLITKEKMKRGYQGKLTNEKVWKKCDGSIGTVFILMF